MTYERISPYERVFLRKVALGLVTMTSWVVSLLLAVSQARLYGWGSMYIPDLSV
jgi:hypothetical protein